MKHSGVAVIIEKNIEPWEGEILRQPFWSEKKHLFKLDSWEEEILRQPLWSSVHSRRQWFKEACVGRWASDRNNHFKTKAEYATATKPNTTQSSEGSDSLTSCRG